MIEPEHELAPKWKLFGCCHGGEVGQLHILGFAKHMLTWGLAWACNWRLTAKNISLTQACTCKRSMDNSVLDSHIRQIRNIQIIQKDLEPLLPGVKIKFPRQFQLESTGVLQACNRIDIENLLNPMKDGKLSSPKRTRDRKHWWDGKVTHRETWDWI